jgi:Cu-processing system permease protein
MPEPRVILTIAGKELRDRLRNRWVLAVALVFTALALVIAYFGNAQQGTLGFRSMAVTIASLVSLVIYLIPLIALMLGFDAIVGERERGTLDLVLSLPLSRGELLIGKYCGLAAALSVATVAGFGAVGAVLLPVSTPADALRFAGFVLSSVALGCAFLSIALMLSTFARDRARASGLAIGAWFFFVLVFDLLLLGGLVATSGQASGDLFAWALLANPADVFRILNVLAVEEIRTLHGLTSLFPAAYTRPAVLIAAMLAWIVLPLAIAHRRFRTST